MPGLIQPLPHVSSLVKVMLKVCLRSHEGVWWGWDRVNFLNSAQDRDGLSPYNFSLLLQGKAPHCPLNKRPGVFKSQNGSSRQETNI